MYEIERRNLDVWQPQIDKIMIFTKEQLREILRNEYSPLLQKPRFVKMLDEAERHLDLIKELRKASQFKWGYLTHLARKFGFSTQQIHKYLKCGVQPRLYWLLERCFSKTEALKRITNIHSELDGLRSFEDIILRLETYYPFEPLTMTNSFYKRFCHAENFFEVFQMLKNGGCLKDVARSLDMSANIVRSWFTKGQKPDLVNLACQIPKEKCKRGGKSSA